MQGIIFMQCPFSIAMNMKCSLSIKNQNSFLLIFTINTCKYMWLRWATMIWFNHDIDNILFNAHILPLKLNTSPMKLLPSRLLLLFVCLFICSFVCLWFFVPLDNFSLKRSHHHCQWRDADSYSKSVRLVQ